jgi:hypothetical protein
MNLRVPSEFAISIGVKKGNTALRDRLESLLQRDRPQIERILAQYGVPMLRQAERRSQ